MCSPLYLYRGAEGQTDEVIAACRWKVCGSCSLQICPSWRDLMKSWNAAQIWVSARPTLSRSHTAVWPQHTCALEDTLPHPPHPLAPVLLKTTHTNTASITRDDQIMSKITLQVEITFLCYMSMMVFIGVYICIFVYLYTVFLYKPVKTLTWYCEVLSVYDIIFPIKHLVVVLLCVTMEILQVWHHRHAPPWVTGFSTGWDGDGLF